MDAEVWPKIPKIPQNLLIQFVCPSPKVWDFDKIDWLKRKVDIGRNISNCIRILVKAWNIEMKLSKIDRLSLNILWRKKLGDTDEDKNWWDRENQSHYREVPRWEIFMEQELRFGMDLGWMAEISAFIASKYFDLWNPHRLELLE